MADDRSRLRRIYPRLNPVYDPVVGSLGRRDVLQLFSVRSKGNNLDGSVTTTCGCSIVEQLLAGLMQASGVVTG